MDLSKDFADAQQAIQASLVAATRAASNIAAQDVSFQRSLNPAIAASLDDKSRRLLQLTERLLQRSATTPSSKISLPNVEAIDSKWTSLVDAADGLFERTDTCLDEYSGLIQKPQETRSPQKQSPAPAPTRERLNHAFRRPDLPKPQLQFDTPTFNHETSAFRPLLTHKPHYITPLKKSFKQGKNEDGALQYQHPYEDEIRAYSYPACVHERASPQQPLPFDSTTAAFVDTEDALTEMLDELKAAKEIAIDLEHHDYHSYIGLVSLVQISTRDRDWVVDTLKPWRRKLEVLNEVFADPSILKVCHGAHMDVIWLQRDLGLYLVGLFDTHHAARVLGYTGKSLAFLLKKFVNFDAQKQYQTADWRIRPLPNEMLDYARSDTHFLLYIYDCMRNELLDKTAKKTTEGQERDCIDDVLQSSKEYCLQRYHHPIYNNSISGRGGWAATLTRHAGRFSQEQVAVFAKLHRWRDETARDEDESVQYVMPNHVLISIAGTLPTNTPTLLAVSHPISPIVKKHSEAIQELIREAKADAANWPDMVTVISAQQPLPFTMGAAMQAAKLEPRVSTDSAAQPVSQPGDKALRTRKSQLWGNTVQTPPTTKSLQQQRYKVLMAPPNRAQTSTDENVPNGFSLETEKSTASDQPAVNGKSLPSSAPIPILGKRKAESTNGVAEAESSSEDESAMMPPRKRSAKAEARAQRKAKKRAEKAAAEQANNVDTRDTEDAENVENATSEKAEKQSLFDRLKEKGKKSMVKGIANPYARAEQAAPGLKRARMQIAGRSGTFRS